MKNIFRNMIGAVAITAMTMFGCDKKPEPVENEIQFDCNDDYYNRIETVRPKYFILWDDNEIIVQKCNVIDESHCIDSIAANFDNDLNLTGITRAIDMRIPICGPKVVMKEKQDCSVFQKYALEVLAEAKTELQFEKSKVECMKELTLKKKTKEALMCDNVLDRPINANLENDELKQKFSYWGGYIEATSWNILYKLPEKNIYVRIDQRTDKCEVGREFRFNKQGKINKLETYTYDDEKEICEGVEKCKQYQKTALKLFDELKRHYNHDEFVRKSEQKFEEFKNEQKKYVEEAYKNPSKIFE